MSKEKKDRIPTKVSDIGMININMEYKSRIFEAFTETRD